MMTLTLDADLSYISDTSGITPTVSGNQIVWDLGDLALTGGSDFELQVSIPDDPLGTTYTSQFAITSDGPEADPEDDAITFEILPAEEFYLPIIQR